MSANSEAIEIVARAINPGAFLSGASWSIEAARNQAECALDALESAGFLNLPDVITYCKGLDGEENAPAIPRRRPGSTGTQCNASTICKCGRGPVVCCLDEHEGPHAAFGTTALLTVWTTQ